MGNCAKETENLFSVLLSDSIFESNTYAVGGICS